MDSFPSKPVEIPLLENSKTCRISHWQHLSEVELYENAPSNHTNTGWRAGKNSDGECWTYIDCDDPLTVQYVSKTLEYMGIDPPEVVTRSSNRHFYLILKDPPTYGSKVLLSDELNGQFAFGSGAYAVSPPSSVDGYQYMLKREGTYESVSVQWNDLRSLIGPKPELKLAQSIDISEAGGLPVPVLYRTPPDGHRIFHLFNALKSAKKGQCVDRYATRSEAEAATMFYALAWGWNFQEWENEAKSTKRYKSRSRIHYLADWKRCGMSIASNDIRKQLSFSYHHVVPTLNLKLDSDRQALKALISIAYSFDTTIPSASLRDLSLLSGKSYKTIERALKRLIDYGFTQKSSVPKVDRSHADAFNLAPLLALSDSIDPSSVDTNNNVSICVTNVHFSQSHPEEGTQNNELTQSFWSLIGRGVARELYSLLKVEPVKVTRLAKQIGRGRSSVYSGLSTLEAHGLAKKTLGGWIKGDTPLIKAAEIARPKMDSRRIQIEADRNIYSRRLKSTQSE